MLVILMYHYIGVPSKETAVKGLFVKPQYLEWQIQYLKKKGFSFLNFEDLHNKNYDASTRNVILTFDDGSQDLYTQGLPIFLKHQVKATVYPVIDNLGKEGCVCEESYDQTPLDYMTKQQLVEMRKAGVEFGSHLIHHIHLSRRSKIDQKKEIQESIHSLEVLTGYPTYSIAYPYGDYNEDSLSVSRELGLKYGVTTHEGINVEYDSLELSRYVVKGQKWRHKIRFKRLINRLVKS